MTRALLFSLVVLGAPRAHAQDREPEPPPGRELIERAVAAFEEGDYQVALDHFSTAYELVPRAEIEFNIGMCLERLGRLREAKARYEHALEGDELGPEGRARARAQLEGVLPRLATLRVTEPSGAEVLVGRDDRCEVPCELVLDPGTHDVVLRDGDARRSREVTLVPGGEEVVRFEPEVAPAIVPPPTETPPRDDGYAPGVLSILGAGLVVAGGAGIVGFGLRTDRLHDEYLDNPTADGADEGETMMLLANVSIGVAVLGGALLLIDLLTQL